MSLTTRVFLACLMAFALVPVAKAAPAPHKHVTSFSQGETHTSDSHSRYWNDIQSEYQKLSCSSLGTCALPTKLGGVAGRSDDEDDVDESGKRRQGRSTSPSTSQCSTQAHTDTEEAGSEVDTASADIPPLPLSPAALYRVPLQLDLVNPPRTNYAMRKVAVRTFAGQLYKEGCPVVLSAMLRALFPTWTQGVDVDMECHTNKGQYNRAKGCAWVWTATSEMQEQLLQVHKHVLVDVDGNGDLQLVVTNELLSMLPHLTGVMTAWEGAETSLAEVAAAHRETLRVSNMEWLLPLGPVTMEVPCRGPSRKIVTVPQRSPVKAFRYNPYNAISPVTSLFL